VNGWLTTSCKLDDANWQRNEFSVMAVKTKRLMTGEAMKRDFYGLLHVNDNI
jgi:hypothetical protein